METNAALVAAVAPVVSNINIPRPVAKAVDDRPLVHTAECAAQHFAPWMIDERWFRSAVEAVKNGTLRPKAIALDEPEDEKPKTPYKIYNGTAIIPIAGPLMKKASKFGGTSSVETRAAIRKAVHDEDVTSILLHIDSPGGTVAGTADLAADVRAANSIKPVYSHIEDLGASAAYWVASQARRITSNATGEVGSIGTLLVLADTSGMYAAQGIKVHVINTGKYKGAGADGAPVTDDHLKMFQEEVDDLNEHFIRGVAEGRKMPIAKVREIADGRCHIAQKAKALGLIDDVASLDVVMSFIRAADTSELEPMAASEQPIQTNQAPEASPRGDVQPVPTKEKPIMADTPTAAPAQAPVVAAPIVVSAPETPVAVAEAQRKELVDLNEHAQASLREQGRQKGIEDGSKLERGRAKAVAEACPTRPDMALAAILSGQSVEAVALAYSVAKDAEAKATEIAATKDAEIKRWQALAATGGYPMGVSAGVVSDANEDESRQMSQEDAKAQATREWDRNTPINGKAARKGFSTKDRYVSYRSAELMGKVTRQTAGATA